MGKDTAIGSAGMIDPVVNHIIHVSAAWHAQTAAVAAGRMPWGFSKAPPPGGGFPNVPTPIGRELGREVARLADIAEADQLKQFPNMRPRCHECAARAGTDPNGCPETLMDLIKCVTEGVPFYCHLGLTGEEDEKPKRLCGGFVVLSGARMR